VHCVDSVESCISNMHDIVALAPDMVEAVIRIVLDEDGPSSPELARMCLVSHDFNRASIRWSRLPRQANHLWFTAPAECSYRSGEYVSHNGCSDLLRVKSIFQKRTQTNETTTLQTENQGCCGAFQYGHVIGSEYRNLTRVHSIKGCCEYRGHLQGDHKHFPRFENECITHIFTASMSFAEPASYEGGNVGTNKIGMLLAIRGDAMEMHSSCGQLYSCSLFLMPSTPLRDFDCDVNADNVMGKSLTPVTEVNIVNHDECYTRGSVALNDIRIYQHYATSTPRLFVKSFSDFDQVYEDKVVCLETQNRFHLALSKTGPILCLEYEFYGFHHEDSGSELSLSEDFSDANPYELHV
jgi:hypothetical protein